MRFESQSNFTFSYADYISTLVVDSFEGYSFKINCKMGLFFTFTYSFVIYIVRESNSVGKGFMQSLFAGNLEIFKVRSNSRKLKFDIHSRCQSQVRVLNYNSRVNDL